MMYAVIFRARVNTLDAEYQQTAQAMRELALSEYDCIEFTSACEGGQEIAISYWHDLEAIRKWKQAAEHLAAQALGRSKWYSGYEVQVTQLLRSYRNAS